MTRRTAIWALAALLGIVLTAGITWATSQLTSQHIGLASEPISAGSRLAPPVAGRPARTRPTTTTTTRTRTITVTAPPAPPSPPAVSTPPASSSPPASSAPVVTATPTQAPRTSRPSGDDGSGGASTGAGHGGRDD